MTKNDFINCLVCAIQNHEGWIDGAPSVENNNPGNLKFAGQANATVSQFPPDKNFARFPDYYSGHQALINDITAKLDRGYWDKSLVELFNLYLGTDGTSADTWNYALSVKLFINGLGWDFSEAAPILQQINSQTKVTILVAINGLNFPADFQSIMNSLKQTADLMKLYAITPRMANETIEPSDVILGGSPIGTRAIVSAQKTKDVISQFSEGQVLNAMIYDGAVMQTIKASPAGGCEYQGFPPQGQEFGALASVMYNSSAFVEATTRQLFHELIHELFNIENIPDILHQYLIDHSGYQANSLIDLQAVYNGGELNSETAVVNLQKTELSFLQRLVAWLKTLF